MKRYRVLVMLLGVAALAALAASNAAAVTADFAKYAPADTTMYFSFPYVKANAAKIQKSNLYKMCSSDEMKKIIGEFGKIIAPAGMEQSPIFNAGSIFSDLWALKFGGFAFAVKQVIAPQPELSEPSGEEDYDPSSDPVIPPMRAGRRTMYRVFPPVETMGAMYLDRANPEIKSLCEKIVNFIDLFCSGDYAMLKKSEVKIEGMDAVCYEKRGGGALNSVYLIENGNVVIFAMTQDFAAEIARCIKGKGKDSLAESDLYKKSVAKLDRRRMTTFFYNIKATREMMTALVGPRIVGGPLEALHLDSVEAIVSGSWADENGVFEHSFIYCPDGKFALLKPFQNGRAKFDTLSAVGGKALMSMSVSADPTAVCQWMMALIKNVDEKAYKQAIYAVKGVESCLGVKIKEDILASFGGEMTLVVTESSMQLDAQILPAPVAIVLEIKDAAKFAKLHDALCKKFDWTPKIESYGRHKIEVLPYFVLCTNGKHCIIANGMRTMESVLDAMGGKAPRLEDSKRFKTARKALDAKPAMLFYFNTKSVTRSVAFGVRWYMLTAMFRPVRIEASAHASSDADFPEIEDEDIPPELKEAWERSRAEMEAANQEMQKRMEEMNEARKAQMEKMTKMIDQALALLNLVGDYMPEYYFSIAGEPDGLSFRSAAP